jgi:hypothetical protein
MRNGSVKVETEPLNDQLDRDFKPGLYEQVIAFSRATTAASARLMSTCRSGTSTGASPVAIDHRATRRARNRIAIELSRNPPQPNLSPIREDVALAE